MFKRLQSRFRESQQKTNNTADDQISSESTVGSETQSFKQGFICPDCRTSYASPVELQSHFEKVHLALPSDNGTEQSEKTSSKNDESKVTTDENKNSFPETLQHPEQFTTPKKNERTPSQNNHHLSNGDTDNNDNKLSLPPPADSSSSSTSPSTNSSASQHYNLENFGSDLGSKIEDESSLKLEISDLQNSLKEEKWYSEELKKELENVENEKLRLKSDLESSQQQIIIGHSTNEELARQKEASELKAANISKEIAELKAKTDEMKSLKEAAEERSKNQAVELEKAANWVRDLESQLLQRPGADDVMVLKKELVSVQTLMDQMSLESEKKGQLVEQERAQLQLELEAAREKALVVAEEFDLYKKENERLRVENQQTILDKEKSSQLLQSEREKMNESRSKLEIQSSEKLSNIEGQLESEREFCMRLEQDNNNLVEENTGLKEQISSLQSEIKNFEMQNGKLTDECHSAQTRLEKLTATNQHLETEITSFREKIAASHSDKNTALSDASKKLDSYAEERDLLLQQLEEANEKLKNANNLYAQSEEACRKLRESNQANEMENNSVRGQLEIEISQFKNKVVVLEADYKQITENLEEFKRSFSEERKKYETERISLCDKIVGGEQKIITFESKIEHLSHSLEEKSTELCEKEKLLNTSLQKIEGLNEQFNQTKQELALKGQELEFVQGQLSTNLTKLKEETKRCEEACQLSQQLRDEKIELIAKMEVGEGEAAARAQVEEENEKLMKVKESLDEKLRDQTINHEKSMAELTTQLSEVKSRGQISENDVKNLQEKCGRLEEEIKSEKKKEEELKLSLYEKTELLSKAETSLVMQRTDQENQVSNLKRSLDEKGNELKSCQEQLDASKLQVQTLKDETNQMREKHGVELVTANSEITNLATNLRFAEGENARLVKQLDESKENFEKEKVKLEENQIKSEKQFENKISNMEKEMATKNENIQSLTLKLSNEENLRSQVEHTLQQVRDDLAMVESNYEKSRNRLDQLVVELNEAKNLLSNEKENLRKQSSENSKQISSLNDANENLKGNLQTATEQNNKLNQEISSLKDKVGAATKEVSVKKDENSKLTTKVENLANSLQEKTAELQNSNQEHKRSNETFTAQINELNSNVSSLRENISSLNEDIDSKKVQVEQLEEKLTTTETQNEKLLEEWKDKFEVSSVEIQSLTKERSRLEATLSDKVELIENTRKEFESKVNDLETTIITKNEELASNEALLKQTREEVEQTNKNLKDLQHKHEEEKEKLQENFDNLQSLHLRLAKEKNDLEKESKEQMEMLERAKSKVVEQLERAAANLQRTQEQMGSVEEKLLEKERELERLEADREITENRLQVEISTLSENMNTVRMEWMKSTDELEASKKENDDLRGRVVVLEATVQNNADERRNLMERCLKFEQNCQQLDMKSSDLQQRLDDSLSAMHELGRENQALQMKHNTTISRTWTDDKTSKDCSACKRQFTITVRRHHCRHCGDIFCADCSSKTATVASSKNPQRVCDRCYEELRTVSPVIVT